MSILGTLGLSSDSADARLAQQRRQTAQLTKKSTTQQLAASDKGYGQAYGALAPALTNVGDIFGGAYGAYNTGLGALGLRGPQGLQDAQAAYDRSLQIPDTLGRENILRTQGQVGATASGGTFADLYDRARQQQYDPWLQRVMSYDPLAANAQNLSGRTTLGGWDIGQGTTNANIFANKFNQLNAANQTYTTGLNANAANVASNWGGLAKGLLNAGVGLAGAGLLPGASTFLGPAGLSRLTGNIGDNPNWNVD